MVPLAEAIAAHRPRKTNAARIYFEAGDQPADEVGQRQAAFHHRRLIVLCSLPVQ